MKNCNVHFTKLTKNALFLENICSVQKKAVPLHRDLKKNDTKLQKIILTN